MTGDSPADGPLALVATCARGLEGVLAGEMRSLGIEPVMTGEHGAVGFTGGWADCWRANWRLRTANRILVELGRWEAGDGAALAAGARALAAGRGGLDGARGGLGGLEGGSLLHPDRTFAIHATAAASRIRDARWAALTAKDGLVDGQRERWGRRSDVDRADPELALRLRLHADRATLLLDTSGEPLDRRGYRVRSTAAPVREQLAAACVLASGWNGQGPVVDPMCGSATLLIEAAWVALGIAPGRLRESWAFERLPGFAPAAFAAIQAEPLPVPGPEVRLFGNDRSAEALRAARANLACAGLEGRSVLRRGEAAEFAPADGLDGGPGLVLVNPPYGERVAADAPSWRALGDLLKKRYRGWQAVVLAGGEGRGKHIGLRPRRRIPVKNGPLDARILLFDLF
jgi:23S rRNA G2445 N2-methylase RlmL